MSKTFVFNADRIEHGTVTVEAENYQQATMRAEIENADNFHFEELETVFDFQRSQAELMAVSDILDTIAHVDEFTQSDLQGRLQAIIHNL